MCQQCTSRDHVRLEGALCEVFSVNLRFSQCAKDVSYRRHVPASNVGDVRPTATVAELTANVRYLRRLDDMQNAAATLRELLDQLISGGQAARADITSGQALVRVLQRVGDEDGREFRRRVHAAARHFERTMQALRGESFRILIEDGDRSLTDVARTAGLSVQMVRRLVQSVE
jgi:hypothetical protein